MYRMTCKHKWTKWPELINGEVWKRQPSILFLPRLQMPEHNFCLPAISYSILPSEQLLIIPTTSRTTRPARWSQRTCRRRRLEWEEFTLLMGSFSACASLHEAGPRKSDVAVHISYACTGQNLCVMLRCTVYESQQPAGKIVLFVRKRHQNETTAVCIT